MAKTDRLLAVITGASTGIGYELARCCAQKGLNLIVAANEDEIEQAAEHFREMGVETEAVKAHLATIEGVDTLSNAIKGRQVDALLANASAACRPPPRKASQNLVIPKPVACRSHLG